MKLLLKLLNYLKEQLLLLLNLTIRNVQTSNVYKLSKACKWNYKFMLNH